MDGGMGMCRLTIPLALATGHCSALPPPRCTRSPHVRPTCSVSAKPARPHHRHHSPQATGVNETSRRPEQAVAAWPAVHGAPPLDSTLSAPAPRFVARLAHGGFGPIALRHMKPCCAPGLLEAGH